MNVTFVSKSLRSCKSLLRGKKRLYDSPARLLVVIVFAVIFAEASEEILSFLNNGLQPGPDVIIDVLYMVIFLSPVLYLFVFKPLLIHIENQKRTQEALRVSQDQLRNLSLQVMVIQEQERKKIAMELHDDVGQAMNLIKLQLRSLRKKLLEEQVTARDDINSIAECLDGVIGKIRCLSRELSPSMLEDLGLGAAFRGMLNDFRNHYTIKGNIDISHSIDYLVSHQDRIFIYRIFQEVMSNISKHAMARTVSVHIGNNDDNILFSIEDDGKGFDVAEVAVKDFSQQGLGLAIMRERARMIGGSIDIWSNKGEGTRISLSIPVQQRR